MEKNKKRAERRFHKKRKQLKVLRKINHQYADPSMWFPKFDEWREEYIRKHADNPASCSCIMCGNPRKHFKEITIQEKKMKDYMVGEEY
jgi:hypothetical protein